MSKRLIGAVAAGLLVAVVVVAAGCTTAKPPRNEFIMYLNEPSYIDPYNGQESEGVQVINDVYDSLVDFDPITSEILPSAAETWSANKDFTVWTFKLRPGAKFHNGREVKAQDFVYAWNRIASPADKTVPVPSEIAYHLAPIKGFDASQESSKTVVPLAGVKALDDSTLEVTLSYPFADFAYVAGHPALAPVPKEEVEKDPKAFSEMPVGNGPFKMAEPWKHKQYIKVVPFTDYWGEKAKVAGVTYKLLKDAQTAFLELQAKKVDFSKTIPSGQIKSTVAQFGQSPDGYTAAPGQGVLLGAETSTYYLNANNAKKPLDDPKVRAALSMAINREAMVQTIYEGTRKAATGLVPPGVVGFAPDQGKYAKYDVEQAKKLLAEAGYPDGKGFPTLELSYNSDGDHAPAMQAVQANLKDIGVNVKLKGMEWAEFVNYRQEGQHQLARDGWVFDYPIMDNMLYPLFFSKNIGADNTSNYKNTKFDKLVLEARQTLDAAERAKKYQEAERVILDDAGAIPLNFYAHNAVAQSYVKGLVLSPLLLVNSNKISLEGAPPAE